MMVPLNEAAIEPSLENQFEVKVLGFAKPRKVEHIDYMTLRGTVGRASKRYEETTLHSFDLIQKTCSCAQYQESGMPCVHAISLFQKLVDEKILNSDFLYNSMIYERSLASTYKRS